MTVLTTGLVKELGGLLEENKYILLQGGIGVGKTYIAKMLIEQSSMPDFCDIFSDDFDDESVEVISELIPVTSEYSYGDFVKGSSAETINEKITIRERNKIFLDMVYRAKHSWEDKKKIKYILILDDINKGCIDVRINYGQVK
jgi:deoxyadenosine/deoxycytidine kinase